MHTESFVNLLKFRQFKDLILFEDIMLDRILKDVILELEM